MDTDNTQFFYLEDYPEFGIINMTKVCKIIPFQRKDDVGDEEIFGRSGYSGISGCNSKGVFKIRIYYDSGHDYDTWDFDNKIIRDAVFAQMRSELAETYISHDELDGQVEEIMEERGINKTQEVLEVLEKKRNFVDPCDLNAFKEVKV